MIPKRLDTAQIVLGTSDHLQLRFAPSEDLVACIRWDFREVPLLSIPEGRVAGSFGGNGMSEISDMCFLRIPGQAAMASADGAFIWDYLKDRVVGHLAAGSFQGPGIIALVSDDDSEQFVLVKGKEAFLLHPKQTTPLASYACRQGEKIVQAMFFKGEPALLLTQEVTDSSFGHFRPPNLRIHHLFAGDRGIRIPYSLAWANVVTSTSGALCVVCTDFQEGLYSLWNLAECVHVAQIAGPPSRSLQFSFHEQKGILAGFVYSVKGKDSVSVWSAKSGALLGSVDVGIPISLVVCSNERPLLAIVANNPGAVVDRTVFVNLENCTVVGETSGHPGLNAPHAFSAHDRWFASASTTNSMDTQVHPSDDTLFLTDLAPLLF